MFFEHIFQTPTFLTLFARFAAFYTSQVFLRLFAIFLSLSALILRTVKIFLKPPRFFDAANLFFTQLKLSFIDTIYNR